MGETISTLVFRPPSPTPIKSDKFFYIRIPTTQEKKYVLNDCNSCGMPSNLEQIFSDAKDTASQIPAFFLRRKGAKITILFSHGNAEDLGMMYRRMKEIAMVLCANVLAYDYTGYGLSTPSSSSPSEAMCYRNIEAAYDHLTKTMRIPPSDIVLYGRSLGTGPSCYLAKKTADEGKSVAGLILHSPFLSIYRIVLDSRVNLVGDMFINRSKAKDVRCPVLVIHGTTDDVVPFWHGDELLRLFPPQCRAQPYWAHGLGHNHIEVKQKKEYVKRITSFLEKYVIPNSSKNVQTNPHAHAHVIHRQPIRIPEQEQYKPELTLQDSGKFVINKTWVTHGKAIVDEAMEYKKKKQNVTKTAANKKLGKTLHNSDPLPILPPTKQFQQQQYHTFASGSTSATTSKHTIRKTTQLKLSQCGSTISNDTAATAASRYILTKESWTSDDERGDVSFDDVKENINHGVSLQTSPTRKFSGFSLESSFCNDACELSIHEHDDEKEDSENLKSNSNANLNVSLDRYSTRSM